MPEARPDFSEWRERLSESPEQATERFLSGLEALSPLSRRALVASVPDAYTLIKSIQTAGGMADAPLSGVPYMLQDLFDAEGLHTRCGAPFDSPFEAIPDRSSLLAEKLNALGAAFFGKTMPAEFGFGLQGRNPTYGDTPHAAGIRFIGGGGAGGSARVVADGLVPLAFGLDTGGGIRVPAAFQGLFGFRMPHNAYAREGAFPIAPSLDSVGWVNHCLSDLRATLRAFYDVPEAARETTPRGALLPSIGDPVSPEIRAGLQHLARELAIDEDPEISRDLRAELRDAARAYDIIEARELYAIHQYWIDEYRDAYTPALLERIETGMQCTPAEAEYAEAVQEGVRTAMARFFQNYDYLLAPISTRVSPTKDDWNEELESGIRRLLAPADIAFLPTLILPMHFQGNRHSAVQLLLNPHRLGSAFGIVDQLKTHYT